MDGQALYDYSPVLHLMLLGALLALGPLAWIWLRRRNASTGQRLAALTAFTLFLTFDLVLFGAFTRLTDSGLGCPDWPGCYGSASPIGASASIAAAQEAMPTGPVTFSKAWVEMIHRYLATAVGVLILVLAVVSWLERRRAQLSPWWPLVTLFWVCLQGAFGALTVTMKLFPAIVTLHLLGGLILLALLAHQAARTAPSRGLASGVPAPGLRRWLLMAGLILLGQIALGGWVSTNYAVLACDTFPMCQGSYWPKMDFAAGFEWWRPLGHTAAGELLSFEALTAIHYVHRLAAYGVMAVLWWVSWRMHQAGLNGYARVLAALVLLQFLTGLSNVVLGWPLLAAVMHTGGAAAMLVVLVLARSRTVSPLHSTIPS